MKLRLQPFNPVLGALPENAERMVAAAQEAARAGMDAVAFPAWALTGAPLDDLAKVPAFAEAVAAALADLERRLPKGLCTIFGIAVPDWDGLRAGAVALTGGEWVAQAYAAGGGARWGWHETGRGMCNGGAGTYGTVDVGGVRLGVVAGEPSADGYAGEGWDACVQLVAEPYSWRPRAEELPERRAEEAAQVLGALVMRLNLLGGQDDLVFAGGVWTPAGNGELFSADPVDVEVEPGGAVRRLNARAGGAGGGNERNPLCDLYRALVLGIRDYAEKNGFPGALVSLSGGIDSALVAALAVDALGAERVMGVTLPSTVTSQETWSDAQELASRLGIECPSIAIEPMVRSFREAMSAESAAYARVKPGEAGTAAENLQARIRGAVVMTLSNQYSRLVLATSNFSESMTGYATLYGDMCGGLAPIARVPKTTVFALAKWRNTRGEVIPPSTIERPPSAELRPGQRDSDSLPPYPVLDGLLEAHVQGLASRAELLARGLGSEAEVERTVRLVRLSEYKRRQAAPALDVDPYRRGMMPVSHKFGF